MKLSSLILFNILIHTLSYASGITPPGASNLCEKVLIGETSRMRIEEVPGAGFIFFLKNSGVRVGSTGSYDGHRFPAVQTEPAFRGQGFATEARFALFSHAFAIKGVLKILATVSPYNLASIHLHQKLGFEEITKDQLVISLALTRERFLALNEWISRHFGSIDSYIQSHGRLPTIYERGPNAKEKRICIIPLKDPLYQFSAIDLTQPPRAME